MLLIGSEYEQSRVLVALLVSISFLSLQFSIRPLKSLEDGAIMVSIQLALIFIYTSILLVKACDMDSLTPRYSDAEAIAKVACSRYGFGDSGQGMSLRATISVVILRREAVTPKCFLVEVAVAMRIVLATPDLFPQPSR